MRVTHRAKGVMSHVLEKPMTRREILRKTGWGKRRVDGMITTAIASEEITREEIENPMWLVKGGSRRLCYLYSANPLWVMPASYKYTPSDGKSGRSAQDAHEKRIARYTKYLVSHGFSVTEPKS